MNKKIEPNSSYGQKLLQMHKILFASNKKHYQSDLARQLNCSPQTVIRLANEIEQNNPESFHSGFTNRTKWYQLKASGALLLGIDNQIIRYLSLSMALSKPYLPQPMLAKLGEIIFKLSTHLLEYDAELNIYEKTPIQFFSKGKIDYSPFSKIIQDLMTSINENYFCFIVYHSQNNPDGKNHFFVPKKMIAMNNALYIYGASINEKTKIIDKTMCLAIHRIKRLEPVKQTLTIDIPKPNANTFGLPWHEPRTLKIKFKQEVAYFIKERIWSENQHINTLDNGDIELTLTTCSQNEVEAWARSFGDKLISINRYED